MCLIYLSTVFFIVLIFLLHTYKPRVANFVVQMWPFSTSCKSKIRLDGKTVIVTGANTGIGKETARDLYRRGARVILACRDIGKANAAAEDIRTALPSKPNREQFVGEPGEVIVCKLDLNSLTSVRECANHILTTQSFIHIIINNAGVMMCPKGVTEDGFETQFGTNHLAHFLFTLLLLPKVIETHRISKFCCRIINVSSLGHAVPGCDIDFDDIMLEKSYTPIKAYTQSKLANVLFTRELANRLKEANITGINTYSLHPGVIRSELTRHVDKTFFPGAQFLFGFFIGPFIKTVEQGAQTTLHCALDINAAEESGLYYKECKVVASSNVAQDDVKASKLWDISAKLVGLPSSNLIEIINHNSRGLIK